MNETNPIATCPTCGKKHLSDGLCKACNAEAIENTIYPEKPPRETPPTLPPWKPPSNPWFNTDPAPYRWYRMVTQ